MVTVSMGNTQFQDKYISKTKFYMKDTESDIWYLQFYVDHKTEQLHSSTSGVTARSTFMVSKGVTIWTMERENLKNFNEVNSYESETLVSQDDAKSNSNLTCRYKTSVVANNRLYVGNIYQNGIMHGDRMIKSPIGKYNLLPKSNFIDVAINDGDEITALAYYKDKLLQFKKRKVFVISTSGDYEFLEDTFENVGVIHQASVCTTPHGIVWANKLGLFLYNGEKNTNLIDNKIPSDSNYAIISNNYWKTSSSIYSNDAVISYLDTFDCVVIKWTSGDDATAGTEPDGAVYNFATNSFSFTHRAMSGDGYLAKSGGISNMISDENGDVLYYRNKSVLVGDNDNSIKKWTHTPLANDSSGSSIKYFYFTTKDFTFGNIAVRKKLYKVYITYKTNSDSAIFIKGAVDGTATYSVQFSASSKFKGTNTDCYGSKTFDDTGGGWKTAELKFETPSLVNNIYSIQFQFFGAYVPVDFEINDISISYKTKRVK